ncbi:response regulator transcription factor [Neptuniibacter sp. QD72_48]|uniref:response regulator transcription factor n=1 Tax=unclassified Neptuniibacter TaxID=2630693 RepID=UPI0039F4DA64
MTENQKGTVFVVDDDATLRDMIRMMAESDGYEVRDFIDASSFLEAFDAEQPGCLVLDIRMPGMSGLALQDELIKRKALIPIIFITGHGDVEMAVECIQKGALDFLEKPFREARLLEKIAQAILSDQQSREELAEKSLVQQRLESLTTRETEIMHLVAQGCANKVIAIDLGIAQGTVEIHRSRVMHKLGVRSVAQLMRLLLVAGLLEDQ